MHLLATSVQVPNTVSFYNIVVFVHISSAVLAFGVVFSYPVVGAYIRRTGDLRHLAWWFRVRYEIGSKVITGGATLLLLAGIYLAASGPYGFGKPFVTVGMVVTIVILGLAGAFFAPSERKAAELAERDIAAARGGEITMSAEYQALERRIALVTNTTAVLVLITIFVMVMKPL
jgi:uncharacterized membrane protein